MGPEHVDLKGLQRTGLRLTPQRRVILDVLTEHPTHLDVERIYQQVHERMPEISRSTVYRTLENLEHLGVVQHTHAGPSGALYHLSQQAQHLHLVCDSCGKVIVVEELSSAERLRADLRKRFGFTVDASHFAIGGLCADCAAGAQSGASARPSHHQS